MLLPKTLYALQTMQNDVIKDTLQDALYDYGVNVALVDIIFGHYFIYVLLSDGILTPVFLHENSITYKQSQAYGLPKLHFCVCREIQNDFSLANKARTLSMRHYVARQTKQNAFSVSVKQGISEVGLYNNYPLELCPLCSDILQQMREGEVINSTLNVYLFSYQWLHLFESHSSLRQKELIALQNTHLKCHKCKKPITLESPNVWLHIQQEIMKICCC